MAIPSLLQQTNEPPTLTELGRLKRIILSTEADLNHIQRRISEEREAVDLSSRAIKNLETYEAEGARNLEWHNTYLDHLKQSKRDLPIISKSTIVFEEEAISTLLCDDIRKLSVAMVRRRREAIRAEILTAKEEEDAIRRKIKTLQAELRGWKSARQLSIDALDRLVAYDSQATSALGAAKAILAPHRRIPREIWTKIFSTCTVLELEELTINGVNNSLQSALAISQVCQLWRNIVQTEARIEDIVSLYPKTYWPEVLNSHFSSSIQRVRSPIYLVCLLSQHLTWYDWNIVPLDENYDNPGVIMISPSETLLRKKNYHLQLHMNHDESTVIQETQNIAYKSPKSLTISSRAPLSNDGLFRFLPKFKRTKELRVINDFPELLPFVDLLSKIPALTILRLEVITLPMGFNVQPFLFAALEELHIRHDGKNPPIAPAQGTILANLRVLGITAPISNFMENIEMGALDRLVVYGPTLLEETPFVSSKNMDKVFEKLRYLEFEDWRIDRPRSPRPEAIFEHLYKSTTFLKDVAFSRCHIDGNILISTLEKKDSRTKVNQLTLRHTTGITRWNCDVLQKLIDNVNVYV